MLFACQKEAFYSCNPQVDRWVKENADEIKIMTRNDFLSYRNDIDRQKGIYAAMQPEQKISLWRHKLEDALKLPWAEKEKLHIESLLDIIRNHSDYFDSHFHQKFENEIDLFSYKWIKYAEEELGWNDELYAISMTLNPATSANEKLVVDESWDTSVPTTRSGKVNLACSCAGTSGVFAGNCPEGYVCRTNICSVARNCGFLFLSECIGLCVTNDD